MDWHQAKAAEHRAKAAEARERAEALSGFDYTAAIDQAIQHERAAERYDVYAAQAARS